MDCGQKPGGAAVQARPVGHLGTSLPWGSRRSCGALSQKPECVSIRMLQWHCEFCIVVQATPPVRDATARDAKPSLTHLDSINSAALKSPEVSSPSHPLSPTTNTPPGDFAQDQSASQGLKSEEEEVKPLGNSSSGRGGSGGSSSFSWASIKVERKNKTRSLKTPKLNHPCFLARQCCSSVHASPDRQALYSLCLLSC